MRFYEFAQPYQPVLKISQNQVAAQTGKTPTSNRQVPQSNTPPTPGFQTPVNVYPEQWKHEWMQKYLAAKIAKSAQTVKPTNDDLAIAFMRYGQTQHDANRDYEEKQKANLKGTLPKLRK
jgi:hypothetical protein